MERCGFCLVIKIPQIWPMYQVLTNLNFKMLWTCIFGSCVLILSMLCLFNSRQVWCCLGWRMCCPPSPCLCPFPVLQGLWITFHSCGSRPAALGTGEVMLELEPMCPSSLYFSAVPLHTMQQGLERGLQILSDKLLTNSRSNFPQINCCSDKWKWRCHVSTRQHCEKNHKGTEALGFCRNSQEEIGGCAALGCVCGEHGERQQFLRELFGFCWSVLWFF